MKCLHGVLHCFQIMDVMNTKCTITKSKEQISITLSSPPPPPMKIAIFYHSSLIVDKMCNDNSGNGKESN